MHDFQLVAGREPRGTIGRARDDLAVSSTATLRMSKPICASSTATIAPAGISWGSLFTVTVIAIVASIGGMWRRPQARTRPQCRGTTATHRDSSGRLAPDATAGPARLGSAPPCWGRCRALAAAGVHGSIRHSADARWACGRAVLSELMPIGRFPGEGSAGRLWVRWGWGAWDGLRVLRLGGGSGAAGVHHPRLSSVPLPRLQQAVYSPVGNLGDTP